LRSINAPRWRRSWNVWISCSQDGPQGSQHLMRFSVGHFALAHGNPWDHGLQSSSSGCIKSIGSRKQLCERLPTIKTRPTLRAFPHQRIRGYIRDRFIGSWPGSTWPSSGLVSLGLAGVPEGSSQIWDRQAGHAFTPSQLSFLVGRGWDCDCRTAEVDAALRHPHHYEHLRRCSD